MNTIGILGGMGSYATCDIFRRILDAFPGEKEWERPRILIDNNCTMPSRVRAILYGDQEEQLVRQMSESVEHLIQAGADRILLGCMTAHHFRARLPHEEKILDILAETHIRMRAKYGSGTEVSCLCTEGSIQAGIWTKALPEFKLWYPDDSCMRQLREFIELVKQNHITAQNRQSFIRYINGLPGKYVLLGCTELPVLLRDSETEKEIIDPISCAIQCLTGE